MMEYYPQFVKWLLRRRYQHTRQLVRTLLHRGKERPRPASFREFTRANSAFWNGVPAKVSTKKEGHILVEALVNHPGYWLINARIARYLSHETGLPVVALLNRRTDYQIRELFASFGVENFLFLSDRSLRELEMLRCARLATRLLRDVSHGDDLLAIESNGIDFGRLICDQFIATTGNGTIEAISPQIFNLLVDALHYRYYCDRLFEEHRIPIVVQMETNYTTWGVLAETALKHDAVIYATGGDVTGGDGIRVGMRRYDDMSQIGTGPFSPTQEVFAHVYEHYRREAIAAVDAHMQRRFSGRATPGGSADAQLAFSKDRHVVSKEELCHQFGWSVDKPIVCILSHVFIDVPSGHGSLFRDYLTWLRSTLQTIRTIDHVNWLVKAHPSEERYSSSRQTCRGEFEALASDCGHVRLLPSDVNTRSLWGIAHAILTVRGTVGIEFSCFGIPCVLAGESPYSGFGFTVEPQSKEEYFALLKNIETLEPLNASQIERARVAAYIYLELSRVESKLIPNFSPYEDYDEDAIWREAANRIREHDAFEDRLYQMLQLQINQKYYQMLNYDWIDCL